MLVNNIMLVTITKVSANNNASECLSHVNVVIKHWLSINMN